METVNSLRSYLHINFDKSSEELDKVYNDIKLLIDYQKRIEVRNILSDLQRVAYYQINDWESLQAITNYMQKVCKFYGLNYNEFSPNKVITKK